MAAESEQVQTVATAHGEVEYETVECTSCGNQVAKKDALVFVIGDLESSERYRGLEKHRFTFETDRVSYGWACEYCRETGPARYPDPAYSVDGEDIVFAAMGSVAMVTAVLAFLGPVLWELGQMLAEVFPI